MACSCGRAFDRALHIGRDWAGFVASARRDAAQERREARKRRADKFEELVAAVYEFDHWLDGIRNRDAFGHDNVAETASPFAKVQSISSIYFPQFVEPIAELDQA
jgi:DNA-binding helix-hairpin-helix protein with protein kinase domain